MPAPVIMVHGAFCAGWAFESFRRPFEAAGHACQSPDLPGRGEGGYSMRDYAAALASDIEACDAPPILIGHSLGGLAAQMAAARAPVAGMILLAPAAPWGVAAASMGDAAISIGLMSLGGPWAHAIEPNRELFATCSLDRADPALRRSVLERMEAESGRALWETFNWWLDPFMTTHVPTGSKTPVLTVAGERDAICPPSSVRLIADRLSASVEVMPGMSHWLIGEDGWEDVAAVCLEWMNAADRAAA